MIDKHCNLCEHLEKQYIDESHIPFVALCGKTREKGCVSVINYRSGPMLAINCPEWCPLTKESKQIPMEENVIYKQFKDLSYTEKNNFLKTLPKHIEWDDVKEGNYYVLPKTQYVSGKIYKVTTKTTCLIHLTEVNEKFETTYASKNIYPNDAELSFLVEYHKY